jgi:hypothetical protein
MLRGNRQIKTVFMMSAITGMNGARAAGPASPAVGI